MSTTAPSLAQLLDLAGDREDPRVVDHSVAQPVVAGASWHPGDDDILPTGRGRRQRGLRLRRALGK